MKFLISMLFMLLLVGTQLAQDPTKAAPESYKLQLENDWIRVLRVHYRAKAKVVNHDHSAWPAAYVYLTDSGPIQFLHEGWDDPELRRPAVKARAFRLSRTNYQNEHHAVNSLSSTDSHFLRIEFKTMHQGRDLAHLRVPPDIYDKSKKFSKVHFDNQHARVTRLATPAGSSMPVTADGFPTMLVILASGKVKGGQVNSGDTVWLAAGETATVEATANSEVEFLRFDIKAPPRKVVQ